MAADVPGGQVPRAMLDRKRLKRHAFGMCVTTPNMGEYTVSELSAALKRTVEDAFQYVRVRGEISGFRGVHTSGHAYFALKDAGARIEAVVWRLTLVRLR